MQDGRGDLPAERRASRSSSEERAADLRRRRQARARRRRDGNADAEASGCAKEIARAEGMLANERFVAKAPAEVVEAEREKLERYRRELDALDSGSTLARVALALARGVRARPDARAARRARRPAARVPGGPRRRHERQVDRDAHDRRAASRARGCASGAYTSPHVAAGTSGFRSTARTRTSSGRSRGSGPRARQLGATQFEMLTAAALAEFAAAGVDAPSSRRGSAAGSTRRTSLDAPVVAAHERRARAHRGARRDARGDRGRRSSPSSQPGATVVLGEPEWETRARARGDAVVDAGRRGREAAEALRRPADRAATSRCPLPGRLERRSATRSATARTTRQASSGCWRGSRPRLRPRRLDPARQGRRGDARTPRAARAATFVATPRATRARSLRRSSPRRAAAPSSEACRGGRDPAEALAARASSRARTAPCSSPARSICSPTSTSARRDAYHEKLASG